ncbi:MAG: DUF1822 family protein [Cyanobacteria bacterium P01_A01_bin.135]
MQEQQYDIAPFSVSLALSAHRSAQQFQRCHGAAKGRQVYLNTLAVYAVSFYLTCLNIETDLAASSSWDPVQQALLNTADLVLPDHGRLECCPVLPGAREMVISPDVSSDRIAYLAVQLSDSLREAQILGYVEAAAPGEVALNQLHPLEDFVPYLRRYAPQPIQLGRWLQGMAEAGWEAVDSLLDMASGPQMAFGFRGEDRADAPALAVRRKAVMLAAEPPVHLQLQVGLQPLPDGEVDVYVQVVPEVGMPLPQGLVLEILDETDAEVMATQAQGTEAMQLQFGIARGEPFSVRLRLADVGVTERFVG